MPVTFETVNGGDPDKALTDLFRNILPTADRMQAAAAAQIARIRHRTQQGVDVDGNPFAPYAESTVKQRTRKGLSSSPVDLTVSGAMLGAMETEIRSDTEFAIAVNDADIAIRGQAINEGTSRMPQRRFFDTSTDELALMRDELFSL